MSYLTLIELNRHFELRERLAKAKEMLASLRAAACPGAQVLTGMPHAPGVSDKVGDLAVEIADLEAHIANLERECETERRAIISFVESIEDDHVRMIIRLRFLYALTWQEVAIVVGGRNSENSVKSACYRFLKSCNDVTHDDA